MDVRTALPGAVPVGRVDLTACRLTGLGSVCRRRSTAEIAVIVTALARRGLRLHGFGVKTGGLHLYGHLLASADSMARSYAARRLSALPGCTGHQNCANCLAYVTSWRSRVLRSLAARGHQADLFTGQDWPPHSTTGAPHKPHRRRASKRRVPEPAPSPANGGASSCLQRSRPCLRTCQLRSGT